MPVKHEIAVQVNQDPAKIKYIAAAISLFTTQLRALSRYEIKSKTYSPYYSGHESSWERESTEEYLISKAGQETGFLLVHRNSTELNFPTKDFPSGIADEEIKITAKLKTENEPTLEQFLSGLFNRLESIVSYSHPF